MATRRARTPRKQSEASRAQAQATQTQAPVDWDDLRYLRAALQAGSLAAAARALRVEHTTIGRRLNALEKSLGAALVVRGPDGLRATPIGAELVPLLDDIERAVDAVRAHTLKRRSHVRLATPSGFAAYFTPRVAELRALDDSASLEIISGVRPVDLQKGEADIALRIGPIADESLIVKKLCDTAWALYASRGYLARRPFITRSRSNGSVEFTGHDVIGYDASMSAAPPAQWLDERTRAGNATVVFRSREMVDMRDAAIDGVGLAVLPCALGDAEPRLQRLTAEPVASRPLSLVYRRDARLSPTMRAVVRFVSDVIADHAELLAGLRPALSFPLK